MFKINYTEQDIADFYRFDNKNHYLNIAKTVDSDIKNRNEKLINAFLSIVETIKRIQGLLEDERLRTRVEGDFRNCHQLKETIYQCSTPFCIVSLGATSHGVFTIVYSIDANLSGLVSELFANTLIRRIYEFTQAEMEPFVKYHSLNMDCIGGFATIFSEAINNNPFHKIFIQDLNSPAIRNFDIFRYSD